MPTVTMELEYSFVEKVAVFLEENCGFTHWWANTLDCIFVLLGIMLVAGVVDFLIRKAVMPLVKKIVAKTRNKWDDLLVDGNVVKYISHIIPVYLIYRLLPLAFIVDSIWVHWLQKVVVIILISLFICLINAAINVIDDIIEGRKSLKGHPYQLIFQVLKVIVFLIGFICMIGVLVNRSPAVLLTGLGASAAIVSLVFKDTIVGFVSGLQLSANGMIQKGDWISLPNMNVDGIVQDITLHTVKVQNFDKSIVTVPPGTLLNTAFLNWKKMQSEGCRRICRAIRIDANSIHILTKNELEPLRALPQLKPVIDKAIKNGYKMDDGGVMSNLALFRVFMLQYIESHPLFAPSETHMVRQLAPTEMGLPVQIYFFIKEVRWVEFEAVQAAVFDHVYASLPLFSLRAYQR